MIGCHWRVGLRAHAAAGVVARVALATWLSGAAAAMGADPPAAAAPAVPPTPAAKGPPAATAPGAAPDFAHDVLPLLKTRCAECHTNGTYKGSFSLDTREAALESEAIVPGQGGASPLVERVTSTDPELRMPPKGPPLAAAEVATLRRWIDAGAPWQAGFSFKQAAYEAPLRPRRPTLPAARPGWEHPIDRIVAQYFADKKLPPPAPLDDAAFLRRVYLDLVGLLPTPAERTAFLRDKSPDRRARLVERLLADDRAYADHWLTFWNDLLRNDYKGTGYIDGGRKQISAWLYRGLLENKPYDQLVRELISPTEESRGFVDGIKWRGRVNASQTVEIQFSQNVSQVFFGINMKCASCHDSFIDRWKLDEAYALAAITAEQPLEIHRCDKATGRTAAPAFLWPELGSIDPAAPRAQRLEQLAALVTHPENGRFQRTIVNRLWQRLFGRGLVHPVDVMANPPWNADLLDYLAAYLVDQKYDLRAVLAHLVTSRAYQSQAAVIDDEPSGDEYLFRGPELKRMTAEQFVDAVWLLTGTGPAKADAPVDLKAAPAVETPGRPKVRAALVVADPLMRSLGRPNREQVVTTRGDVLTTLQALDLSNGAILAGQVTRGAEGYLRRHAEQTPAALAADVYLRALGRRPTPDEEAVAVEILSAQPSGESVADLLWVVVMLPEFQLIR